MAYPIRAVLSTLVAFVFGSLAAYAQPQAVTRVEGFIKNETTGAPVGCKIYVYGPDGDRIRSIKSNSGDGGYLLVLNDAGTHKLVLGGHNVYRKEFEVDVPRTTDFAEIKRDFTVREFEEGLPLYSGAAFELNSAMLTPEARHALGVLKEDMTVNQQLRVDFAVYPDEDQLAAQMEDSTRAYLQDSIEWAKELKKFERKYRRKKEKPEPPAQPERRLTPEDPNLQLVKDRAEAIEEYFAEVRNSDLRVTVKANPLPTGLAQEAASEEEILKELTAKKSKKRKSSKSSKSNKNEEEVAPAPTHDTLIATIGEVKRLFGD